MQIIALIGSAEVRLFSEETQRTADSSYTQLAPPNAPDKDKKLRAAQALTPRRRRVAAEWAQSYRSTYYRLKFSTFTLSLFLNLLVVMLCCVSRRRSINMARLHQFPTNNILLNIEKMYVRLSI